MPKALIKTDGNVFQEIIEASVRVPGVRIDRKEFLIKNLSKHFQEDTVNMAVEYNPAKAGISTKDLHKIAKSCINYETKMVTVISAATGLPGGYAMAVSVPADLTQYFAHVIRVLQKLIYLYGWKDIFEEDGGIDDETLSLLTLFMGVMFEVQAANKVISKMAANAALRANKVIAAKPLTKGVVYPVVKKIALAITGKMNKTIFARGVSKIIPVIGAATSGGLTFITFKPMANRLKKHLETLSIADTDFYENQSGFAKGEIEIDISDIEDGDFDFDEKM